MHVLPARIFEELPEGAELVECRNRTEEQREEIRQKVAELEKLDVVQDIELTGTQWRTLYTTSTGNSSGKLGPFIGTVRQIFPSGELAGKYFNNFQLGPFGVSLRGVYTKACTTIHCELRIMFPPYLAQSHFFTSHCPLSLPLTCPTCPSHFPLPLPFY